MDNADDKMADWIEWIDFLSGQDSQFQLWANEFGGICGVDGQCSAPNMGAGSSHLQACQADPNSVEYFWDDLSGKSLDRERVKAARLEELSSSSIACIPKCQLLSVGIAPARSQLVHDG